MPRRFDLGLRFNVRCKLRVRAIVTLRLNVRSILGIIIYCIPITRMHQPGLGPADYPVLQCLGQTCTGIVYIQEVLYHNSMYRNGTATHACLAWCML